MKRSNLKQINEWITLFTNMAVLAGLIVLVLEVNQNTTALQNESDVAVYSIAAENARLLVENDALRQVYQSVNAEPGIKLSNDQKLLLSVFWGNEVDRAELQYRLYQRNHSKLDNIVFFEPDLRLPAFQEWWSATKNLYESDFVQYLDELSAKNNHQK